MYLNVYYKLYMYIIFMSSKFLHISVQFIGVLLFVCYTRSLWMQFLILLTASIWKPCLQCTIVDYKVIY